MGGWLTAQSMLSRPRDVAGTAAGAPLACELVKQPRKPIQNRSGPQATMHAGDDAAAPPRMGSQHIDATDQENDGKIDGKLLIYCTVDAFINSLQSLRGRLPLWAHKCDHRRRASIDAFREARLARALGPIPQETAQRRVNRMTNLGPSIGEALSLSRYLEVAREKYDACLARIDQPLQLADVDATVRFKYVKFDSNGRPKFSDLAECLVDHITQYCLSAQRRKRAATEADRNRLNREARNLFTRAPTGGEAGELLLYFLMETVLQAPQMVAKMELKTSSKMELHGSDGIHMRWNEADKLLDVYFGEAKLHESVSSALDSAFRSITEFHQNDLAKRELSIVTSHYKWADNRTKELVLRYIDRQDPVGDCRLNHSCLIGYDWKEYQRLDGEDRHVFIDEFTTIYRSDTPRLIELLKRRFQNFTFRQFHFEVFVLPFRGVQEFRDAFNKVL